MLAIYKRELRSYFNSMLGYVVVAFLTAFIGIYFMVYNLHDGIPYFSYALSSVMILYLLIIPVLTMRSFAEERHTKTDQLLLTSPLSLPKIVIGKYLAMVTVLVIPILISCFCPLIIQANGVAYLKADYASIFAFFLLGCIYIAVGMFISSLTESQVIAAVGTFGVLLLLYLWNGLVSFIPTTAMGSFTGLFILFALFCLCIYSMTKNWILPGGLLLLGGIGLGIVYFTNAQVFEHLLPNLLSNIAPVNTFENFVFYSVFDVAGIIYYITLIVFFVFLTIQGMQKRRWS